MPSFYGKILSKTSLYGKIELKIIECGFGLLKIKCSHD